MSCVDVLDVVGTKVLDVVDLRLRFLTDGGERHRSVDDRKGNQIVECASIMDAKYMDQNITTNSFFHLAWNGSEDQKTYRAVCDATGARVEKIKLHRSVQFAITPHQVRLRCLAGELREKILAFVFVAIVTLGGM
mgnify:CR=1 FL=1